MKNALRLALVGFLMASFVIGIVATTTVEAKPKDCFVICNYETCMGKECCYYPNGIQCKTQLVPCCSPMP